MEVSDGHGLYQAIKRTKIKIYFEAYGRIRNRIQKLRELRKAYFKKKKDEIILDWRHA